MATFFYYKINKYNKNTKIHPSHPLFLKIHPLNLLGYVINIILNNIL